MKRSEIVRQALRDWLKRRAVERFEREWIDALGARPDEASDAEAWAAIQAWSKR